MPPPRSDALVIIPTYNERQNLALIVPRVLETGVDILVVDDNSPDGTGEVADGLARVIPAAVDALTPGGRRPTGQQLDSLDLGALLSDVDVRGLLS